MEYLIILLKYMFFEADHPHQMIICTVLEVRKLWEPVSASKRTNISSWLVKILFQNHNDIVSNIPSTFLFLNHCFFPFLSFFYWQKWSSVQIKLKSYT